MKEFSAVELIALMWKIARADQKLDINELRFIYHLGELLKLSRDEVDLLSTEYDKYPLTAPSSDYDRHYYLYQLLFLIRIDKEVSAEEVALIHKVGLKLGIRDELLNELIEIARDSVGDSGLPTEKMIAAVNAYLN